MRVPSCYRIRRHLQRRAWRKRERLRDQEAAKGGSSFDRIARTIRLISKIRVLACICHNGEEMGHEAVHRSCAWVRRFGRFRSRRAAHKPYEGVTLNLASQNDQFAAVLAAIAPEFEALTGAKVNVDILSYPELLTKITADYVGHTKGYDLATVDIVWSGQFAEAGYTVDLTDWIKRDAAEIKVDDIYPSLMASLGGYKGKQVAFPFAGYANVLAYRKDLYEAAGLKPPATMEDFVADAIKLTDKSRRFTVSSPMARKARRWRRTGCSTIASLAARSSTRTASRR